MDKYISLADKLPTPPPTTTVELGEVPHITPFTHRLWNQLDTTPLPLDQLNPPARLVQQLCPKRGHDHTATWTIYADGSYHHDEPAKSAWVFVAITTDPYGFAY